ncbi:MAG: 2-C-methyl-D-erythritol 4-phosphate cytidylyltransferase [Paludibacteraceae bacterium]|nr:2-C-methyl-D-erythritol 4-phosphate cytidylyltransferase [Paludibacteraceae bacterium]
MTNIAVILAGGMGTRVGGNIPKQLIPLSDGRSVLEHSVDAFEAASCIDEIVIVMHPEWLKEAEELCRRNTWQKVRQIIAGGSERWESSWHAIQAFSGQLSEISLWLHDAARPFVSQRILSDVAEALETHAAVTVAVPVTDTLYKVRRDDVRGTKEVETIPSRADFMRAQTPQAFHLDVLKEAFERALAQGQVAVTDDVGIVQAYMPEQPIFIVSGEEANRKITYAEDLK